MTQQQVPYTGPGSQFNRQVFAERPRSQEIRLNLDRALDTLERLHSRNLERSYYEDSNEKKLIELLLAELRDIPQDEFGGDNARRTILNLAEEQLVNYAPEITSEIEEIPNGYLYRKPVRSHLKELDGNSTDLTITDEGLTFSGAIVSQELINEGAIAHIVTGAIKIINSGIGQTGALQLEASYVYPSRGGSKESTVFAFTTNNQRGELLQGESKTTKSYLD
jgi:hypothetical protein